MKQIRKRLTYANVMSSIAVFLILGGASALAANQLGKNTVGAKQLKKNAVTAAKIKKNAVTTAKIKKGAVTGAKINESTLGTVPSAAKAATATSAIKADSATTATTATTASTASNLAGQIPFFVRLDVGRSQTLASNGSVSMVAECFQEGGDNIARILEQTSQNGAVAGGSDDWAGGSASGDFLNVDTPANERELVSNSAMADETNVESYIDQGFVIGPDNKMLTTNSEGIALGLNYGAPGCLFAGVINAVG